MPTNTIQRDKTPTVEQAARLIQHELRSLGDARKAQGTQRYFTEPVQALGIDSPTLRRVGRTWLTRLSGTWQMKEATALCERLFRSPYLETRGAAFLILGGFKREFDRSLLPQAERWLRLYLDNWALVDGFASTVLSPLLQRHPECAPALRRWTRSRCMWVRRAAAVTLVPCARHGEHLDLAYELAEALLGQKEDLMHKAVGWLLREAGKPDPGRLQAFLLRHRAAIPRTTVRYAIERFPAAERQQLLEQTRRSARADPKVASARMLAAPTPGT